MYVHNRSDYVIVGAPPLRAISQRVWVPLQWAARAWKDPIVQARLRARRAIVQARLREGAITY